MYPYHTSTLRIPTYADFCLRSAILRRTYSALEPAQSLSDCPRKPIRFCLFCRALTIRNSLEKKGENLLTLPQRFVLLYNIHACFVKRHFVTFLCHMIPILKIYRHCLLSAFMEIAQCKVNTLYNQFVTAERTFFRNAVHIRKQIGSDSNGNNALLWFFGNKCVFHLFLPCLSFSVFLADFRFDTILESRRFSCPCAPTVQVVSPIPFHPIKQAIYVIFAA